MLEGRRPSRPPAKQGYHTRKLGSKIQDEGTRILHLAGNLMVCLPGIASRSMEGDMTMEYGHIEGVTKPVARLVQGTVMVSTKELERSFALLDAVFEQGGTTFDTAHGYGG